MHRLAINYNDFQGLARSILSAGGSFQFVAAGNSMWPFIRSGALLSVMQAESSSLKIGEVVLYTSRDRVAVHRIVQISRVNNSVSYVLRGDGCSDDGETIGEDFVIGRVTRIEDNGVLGFKGMIRSVVLVEAVRRIRRMLGRIAAGILPKQRWTARGGPLPRRCQERIR